MHLKPKHEIGFVYYKIIQTLDRIISTRLATFEYTHILRCDKSWNIFFISRCENSKIKTDQFYDWLWFKISFWWALLISNSQEYGHWMLRVLKYLNFEYTCICIFETVDCPNVSGWQTLVRTNWNKQKKNTTIVWLLARYHCTWLNICTLEPTFIVWYDLNENKKLSTIWGLWCIVHWIHISISNRWIHK